jgi:hypothetical protein
MDKMEDGVDKLGVVKDVPVGVLKTDAGSGVEEQKQDSNNKKNDNRFLGLTKDVPSEGGGVPKIAAPGGAGPIGSGPSGSADDPPMPPSMPDGGVSMEPNINKQIGPSSKQMP